MVGLEAREVTVEAFVGSGLPGFHVIGSSGTPAREAGDRVRTALSAYGFALGARKILVSLAPADVPKAGARFDLAMAVAVLAQCGQVPATALTATALIGELGLDGGVRPVPGVLPSAVWLGAQGVRRVLVADANAAEARVATASLEVVPVAGLAEAVAVLGGGAAVRPVPPATPVAPPAAGDLADVRGQQEARRALEIAAAGGHHLLLVGPPGCGKSMLATRMSAILPALSEAQALELAAVRSVAGVPDPAGGLLDHRPPFRAPHHTATGPALLGGGGGIARPGEVSLASGGILFLDELFQWPRRLLDALRAPLSDGVVRVARAQATVTYPAAVQLVAATNPCPCARQDGCVCSEREIATYRGRLTGPVADRLDLAPSVHPLTSGDLLGRQPGETSTAVAGRVAAARAAASERWADAGARNATAPMPALRRSATEVAQRALADAVDAGLLTGRGYDRTLRVARTCADLAGVDAVHREHVLEALGHRLTLRDTGRLAETAR